MMLRSRLRTASGTLLVFAGVAVAGLTWQARRENDWEVAKWGAIASLVFVALITIFVVPPLLRSARKETRGFDAPVKLTGGGLIFVGILSVVAVAAYNTGNNLLFLVFSVLASTLFVSWAAGRASLRDLSVAARFPDHIFAGEPAPVLVSVRNAKRLLPSLSVLVEARHRLDEDTRRRWLRRLHRRRFDRRALAYFTYVPRSSRAEQRVEQTFPQRGHVLVTGFELSTRFPFGFFRLRRRLRARKVDLIIYPKLEPASDELHLLPINAGRLLSTRRGAGHDLHSLREYQPRDDVRHIDWKATARAGHLFVREFTSEDERRVHIAFDTRPAADEGASEQAARFERGVTLAAALVAHFIEERAEVRLSLGEDSGSYGTGREHLYASLRRLALVAPSGAVAAAASQSQLSPMDFWDSVAHAPSATHANYVILITAAAPGTIPAHVWRMSHVIYL